MAGSVEQRTQLALRLLRLLDVPLDPAIPCSNDPRHVERQLAADAADQLDGARLLLGRWSSAVVEACAPYGELQKLVLRVRTQHFSNFAS
jgi:hypothetical protein